MSKQDSERGTNRSRNDQSVGIFLVFLLNDPLSLSVPFSVRLSTVFLLSFLYKSAQRAKAVESWEPLIRTLND